MFTLLLIFATSCVLCSLLTPLAGFFASLWGLVDRPDARRKLHRKSIPVAGGLAVFVSGCVVLGAAFLIPGPLQVYLTNESTTLLGLLLSGGFICGLGVLDDVGFLRGRHKLLGQTAAVGIVMAFGVAVDRIEVFGWNLELGILSRPFTLLWLLGAINSLNLLDGMDGMLGCVGVIITLALAGMAVLGTQWAAACVAVALAGTLVGFLRWNLPPASIFLGDAGSMLTGLVVGVLAIQSSLKSTATVTLIAPLVMLTVPFLDTLAALVRRRLTGRSIYATDRGHLHHCLLRRGYSVPVVLALVSLFCALSVVGALASLALKNELIAVCSTLTVVCILVATRLFGYAEFLLVRQHLAQFVSSCLQLRRDAGAPHLEVHMHGTGNWKALVTVVTEHAPALNLHSVCLDISAPALHEEYYASWQRSGEKADAVLWRAEVPLTVANRPVGRLLVSGSPDSEPLHAKLATLCRMIEDYQRSATSGNPRVHWQTDHLVATSPEEQPWEQPQGEASEPMPAAAQAL